MLGRRKEGAGGVSALQGSPLIKRHFLSCTSSCRAQNAESIPGYSWGGGKKRNLKRRRGEGRGVEGVEKERVGWRDLKSEKKLQERG